MTDLAWPNERGLAVAAEASRQASRSANVMPAKPSPPTRSMSRRVRPPQRVLGDPRIRSMSVGKAGGRDRQDPEALARTRDLHLNSNEATGTAIRSAVVVAFVTMARSHYPDARRGTPARSASEGGVGTLARRASEGGARTTRSPSRFSFAGASG